MKLLWEYDLPTGEFSDDYQYEGPILVKESSVYFIGYSFINDKRILSLYIIDKESGKTQGILPLTSGAPINLYEGCISETTIPEYCFFEEYNSKIIIYTGVLWIFDGEKLTELSDLKIDGRLNSYFIYENYFFFVDRSSLYCIDLETEQLKWKIHIPNTKNYAAGTITLFENSIACYGNDELLFVDISNGAILDQIKIPRVDKLFSPIRMEDGTLLIGFTNWSNAGILRYDCEAEKVIWKSSRSFEGPLHREKIFIRDGLAYCTKNDTELVCVNIENGDEVYRARTTPWLYTDLTFINGSILYGTSGRDGFLVSLDARSGKEEWSLPLKNGCAFFDLYDNSVILGDFEKRVYQIDIENGKKLQEMQTDGEVVGRVKVHQNDVYTVVWGNTERSIRLIKLEI